MATQDLTSPVAANQLAAGAFFLCENDNPWILQALLLLTGLPQALFFGENDHPWISQALLLLSSLPQALFFGENGHPWI